MSKDLVFAAVVALASSTAFAKSGAVARPPVDPKPAVAHVDGGPTIQLAILLDTSNSMDGLIDQARSQLWTIVNEFTGARRGTRPARLEVALYEYGNNTLTQTSGWVRRVLPFTTDLDRVSEELFALDTNGGDEFCGTVIQAALDELAWSPSPADLKVIFVAGNEPFTQGPVDARKACARAAGKGVVVNTIHCGDRREGIATGWEAGARIAYGSYSTIDQGKVVEHVAAPQDDEIARLGAALNRTYVPYGAQGRAGQMRQETQDRNAAKYGMGSTMQRSLSKANRHYANEGWDLVDAVREKQVDLGTVKTEDLPEEMRRLTLEERKAVLEKSGKERERLQGEINRLNAERQTFVAEARKKKGAAADTLDVAMATALRDQAAKKEIALEP